MRAETLGEKEVRVNGTCITTQEIIPGHYGERGKMIYINGEPVTVVTKLRVGSVGKYIVLEREEELEVVIG